MNPAWKTGLAILSGTTKKTPEQNAMAKASQVCSTKLKAGSIKNFTDCVRGQLQGHGSKKKRSKKGKR